MNDQQLRNFIEIAKIGSFSKAEEELNMTKTALKKQIDNLESELGIRLFIRKSSGLKLSKSGLRFYDGVNKLITETDELIRECREIDESKRQKIRIGLYSVTSMQTWYMNVEQNSNLRIEYIYLSSPHLTHESNFQLLKDKKLDFLEYEDNRMLYFENLRFQKITNDQLCCVMRGDHPLADRGELRLTEMKNTEVYCWTSDSSATRALKAYARNAGIDLKTAVFNINTVMNTCNSGGIYILSSTTANQFAPFRIIPIKPKIPYYRGLIYLPENQATMDEMIKASDPNVLFGEY